MKKIKLLIRQTDRQEQRMRNIVIVLAMFVCTSICLGDPPITIDGDIVDWKKVGKLEQQRQQQQEKDKQAEQKLQDQLQHLESLMPQQVQPQSQSLQMRLQRLQMQETRLQALHKQQQKQHMPPLSQELKQVLQQMQEYLKQQPQQREMLVQLLEQMLLLRQRQLMLSLLRQVPQHLPLLRQLLEQMTLPQQRRQAGLDLEQLLQHLEHQQRKMLLELLEKLPLLDQNMWQQHVMLQQRRQLESERKYSDIAGNGNPNSDPDKSKHGKALTDGYGNAIWNNPNNNHLFINPGAKVGNAFGAKMNKASIVKNKNNKDFLSMTNNEVIVSGGEFACGGTNGDIAGAWADDSIKDLMNISSNTVIITGGTGIRDVFGGRTKYGTVSSNTVTISNSVTIERDVYGAWIRDGLASSNTVTITSGTVQNVYGGYIVNNGTATLNKVNLTSVTATKDVYGAWIGNDGLASSNTATIINGETVQNVYGGYIVKDGTATGNTVTINGGKIVGNVFGGYVGGNGEATYNTINITAAELSSKQSFPEFSTESILCGGICADADKNDAFTGNTLNIETKGVVVKGISNFEKYKFNLKDIKPGDTVLTATGGGCSWDIRGYKHTSDCAVDLSKSSISSLRTQGVLNKKDRFTLIKSPHGFEGKVETKQCEFENEGLLIKYYWDIKIADNKEDLEAILADKKIRDEGFARSLSEGYGAGVVCVNNGMDCIFSKMEETEKLSFEELSSKEQSTKSLLGEGAKLQREGEIGVFYGLAANKSSYNTGLHIDMIGTSMMGGVGVRVEVGRKEQSSKKLSSKEQNSSEQSSDQSSPELSSKKPSSKELGSELTVGVFVEHGTGNSEIIRKKKSKGSNEYTGGGVLGKYTLYEDEERGRKVYGEAVLRAGHVSNRFKGNVLKDERTEKEIEYNMYAMYVGCAVGGGYKHKVSEKIDLDWSLRYMFGRQGEKDVTMSDLETVKFENVISNRIKVGVRGTYRDIEQIKPYVGIWYEHELGGKVKAVVQDGKDQVKIPTSDFGGVTGIGELGVSGKIWKFGVDISGQGYLGVRKGFGGMLKLKYAFGKDAHGSKASSKAPRS